MTEHMSVPKTVPAHEIEVKTDPLVLKMGMAPSAAGPRPDLAGLRQKHRTPLPYTLWTQLDCSDGFQIQPHTTTSSGTGMA
jgi:hypothetical protein